MRRRRSTFQRVPQPPWWAHPVFLLPIMSSFGLIGMVIVLRLMGYGS